MSHAFRWPSCETEYASVAGRFNAMPVTASSWATIWLVIRPKGWTVGITTIEIEYPDLGVLGASYQLRLMADDP
jgi:hypothetical protein